nr:hypothetical protein C5F59_10680 [Streptomyces sp. QL37]
MSDRDWYGDREYCEADRQAERATRFGWAAIAGTAGAPGCALVLLLALCVIAAAACLCAVVAVDY